MHEHGVTLAPLGLDGAVEGLLGPAAGLGALLAERFGDVGGGSIDGWHAYLVEYASGLDEEPRVPRGRQRGHAQPLPR